MSLSISNHKSSVVKKIITFLADTSEPDDIAWCQHACYIGYTMGATKRPVEECHINEQQTRNRVWVSLSNYTITNFSLQPQVVNMRPTSQGTG